MESVDVDAATLFDRLRPETLFEGEWAVVHQQPSLTVARKTIAPEVWFLRVESDVDLSLADMHASIRPEVFFNNLRPSYDPSPQEGCVERVLAPGDAICCYRPVFGAQSGRLDISCAAVLGTAQAAAHAIGSGDSFRVRWIVRRDFPSAGHCAMLSAPVCPESGALREELGMVKALVVSFRRHPDDPERRTTATEIRLVRAVPDWSMKHMAGHFLRWGLYIQRYTLSDVYEEIRSGAHSYVVVCIRRLTGGLPLLPGDGATSASDWEPVQADTTCAWYLQTFLSRIGVEVEVYTTLDSRRLVYYQAALWCSDWERACTALDSGPWSAHCFAFRKRYGRKNIPQVAICAEPKFRDDQVVDVASATPALETHISHQRTVILPVVGTFLHYAEPPGL